MYLDKASLLVVFSFLPYKDRYLLRGVSKLFRELFDIHEQLRNWELELETKKLKEAILEGEIRCPSIMRLLIMDLSTPLSVS
jgi:hypothetical protein